MKPNKEKAAVTYLAVLQDREERGQKLNVSLEEFLRTWEELFPMKSSNPYLNMNLDSKNIRNVRKKAYTALDDQFAKKTIADVLAYRNTLLIVEDRTIPEDLRQRAKEKKLFVALNDDTTNSLSGYNIFYSKHCLTTRPYQLTEKEVRETIAEFPENKAALVKQEKNLLNMLHDESIDKNEKLTALKDFKMLYTTHDFQVAINRYLFKYCTDKDLALEAIRICAQAGIVNLQNGKPIMLRHCKAADKKTRQRMKKKRRQ